MEKRLFEKFRSLAYDKAGIALKDGKETLVSARVAKRQRALNIPTAKEYLDFLERDETGEELVHFLDAISTNFTSFYREADHFEILSENVKHWYEAGQRKFRIWCAASSSGEEPYTIVITMLEALEKRDFDFRLLATDISTRILKKAMAGVYEEKTVAPVKKATRLKYMERGGRRSEDSNTWSIKPFVKDYVVFKRLNLSTPPFPMKGPMDVVMCRNVMIYFDNIVRQRLVAEIERLLKPGGILMIGHTETLTGLKTNLKVIKPSVYRKMG